MKIWEMLKEKLLTNAVNGNLFYTSRTLPQTNKEKYWYNRGLHDSLIDVRNYEKQCDALYSKKYNSLIKCLSQQNILVYYDEATNTTHLTKNDEMKINSDDIDDACFIADSYE